MTPAARADLLRLYQQVEHVVSRAAPRCEVSGRCCRFDEAGHELWASALEVAYALEHAEVVPAAAPGRCPWHVGGLCTLRDGRPLGCRTYFCDPTFTDEGQRLHESLHRELVALHDVHQVPYRYARFVDAVRVVPVVDERRDVASAEHPANAARSSDVSDASSASSASSTPSEPEPASRREGGRS